MYGLLQETNNTIHYKDWMYVRANSEHLYMYLGKHIDEDYIEMGGFGYETLE